LRKVAGRGWPTFQVAFRDLANTRVTPLRLRWIKIANIFPDTIVTGLKKTGEKMIRYVLRMKPTQRVGHLSVEEPPLIVIASRDECRQAFHRSVAISKSLRQSQARSPRPVREARPRLAMTVVKVFQQALQAGFPDLANTRVTPLRLRWIEIANIFPDTIVTGLKKTGEIMIHYALRMKPT
jgi:hypothetical protein